jgi:hypothetical protein
MMPCVIEREARMMSMWIYDTMMTRIGKKKKVDLSVPLLDDCACTAV